MQLDHLTGLRLAMLNWRDLDHPRAGGAEVYCQEIAERFAAAGAEVTLLAARFPGAARREARNGVDLRRRGGTFSVYGHAAAHLLRHRNAYDAVLDFQNGIPFFAPLSTGPRTAVVGVVHHVHQEQFALHYPAPLSHVGRLLEGPVSRLVYGRRPIVVVSPSTRQDVRRRLRLRGPIFVVPNGVAAPPAPDPAPRAPRPRIALVSRLVPQKRLDLLLDALPELRRRWPGLRADVAGEGPAREDLECRARALGLGQDAVTFHGFVDDEHRRALLASAWLTVVPSRAEGWGLTVLEANAAGLPAVAFAVPGLRDAVLDGRTGRLLPEGDDLADGIDALLRDLADPAAADRITRACVAWAGRFRWDMAAERMAGVVLTEVDRVRGRRPERRTSSDLAVRVDLAVDSDDPARATLPRLLRRTDLCHLDGTGARLLLHGCDETGAEAVLERLRAERVHRVAVATQADLLVGAFA